MTAKAIFLSIFIAVSFLLALPFYSHSPAFALVKKCYLTQIGPNAPKAVVYPAGCDDNGSDQSGFSKTIADAIGAYKSCKGGKTYRGGDACLRSYLSNAGYKDKNISAFLAKRYFSQRYGCVECSSFVQIVLSLYSGSSNVTSGNGGDFASYSKIVAGGVVFRPIGRGEKPKPGDIGSSGGSTYGHVLFVKEAQGSSKFIGSESNWTRCTVTDTTAHLNSTFTFFRIDPATII